MQLFLRGEEEAGWDEGENCVKRPKSGRGRVLMLDPKQLHIEIVTRPILLIILGHVMMSVHQISL